MALKATIFKVDLQIADMDRKHYADYALTLARHPSETDERMMVRLLLFALYADPALTFGSGLSADDEPALWRRDLTGAVELWIAVGLPDERALRKACGRARRVLVAAYGGRGADVWWKQNASKLGRLPNLGVFNLPQPATQGLARMAGRARRLQCSIQEGQAWLTDGETSVTIVPEPWQGAKTR